MARVKQPTKADLPREQRTRYGLKKARKDKKWTTTYAAYKLHVSRNYLSGIEDGRRDAYYSSFWEVASEVYKVPIEDLKKQGV